jgi:SAM-dependent methyltransferase
LDSQRLSERSAVPTLAQTVEHLLACPRCHGRLRVSDARIVCRTEACHFTGGIADEIVSVGEHSSVALFDAKHQVMQHGSDKPGVRRLCYAEQASFLEQHLRPGSLVLDVGCGPRLPYRRVNPYFLIGLDPSYESLRQNMAVDLRVYGHAGALPLPDGSVDTILSLYAIHHFGGQTLRENQQRVERGFAEFGRVLKPGGELFIFELEPWWPFWKLQVTLWDRIRRILPGFDILFWRERALKTACETQLHRQASYTRTTFSSPMFMFFAPVFAFPHIQVPRLAFPFTISLYHWQIRS